MNSYPLPYAGQFTAKDAETAKREQKWKEMESHTGARERDGFLSTEIRFTFHASRFGLSDRKVQQEDYYRSRSPAECAAVKEAGERHSLLRTG